MLALLACAGPDGPALDPLLVLHAAHDPLHVDAGRVDQVRVELAREGDVRRLDDRHLRGGAHHRPEVPGRLAEDEVSPGVRLPCVDEREVGPERQLEEIGAAVDDAGLLSLRHLRADAGRGVEAAQPRAPRPDPLGERPLRHELHLDLAGEVLPLELLVLADVGRDDLPDLLRLEEGAEAELGRPAVVGDERQALHALPVEGRDEVLGIPAEPEPRHHDAGAVRDIRDRLVRRRDDLVHGSLLTRYRSTMTATASPPPMHSDASPRRFPRSFIAWSSVTRIRAPDAPMGWPSTTAPPRTFTLFPSSPRSRLFAIETTANASLISQRSTSFGASPAPPSLMEEEFAAVTVPSFLNTGLSAGIFSGLAAFGPSSSATTVFSPFFPSSSTGTISALKAPDRWASTARRVDSIAYSSCAAREMSCVVAQCSAHIPMCCWPYTSQRPSWIIPSTSSTLPIRTPARAARS